MKSIKLGRKKLTQTIIDNDDYQYLNQWNWSLSSDGYATRYENGKTIRMHRIITNCPSDKQIDHINGNRLDNRKENLRVCTHKDNAKNVTKSHGTTSKYKGVSWHKNKQKWRIYIRYDGKQISLGYHQDETRAAEIYNYYASHFFGKFAKLNEIPKVIEKTKKPKRSSIT